MPSSRTFSGVTVDILTRMKEFGRAQYNIVYDPAEGPVSTATSQTPLGECVVEFAHDAAKAELTLTLVSLGPASPTNSPPSRRSATAPRAGLLFSARKSPKASAKS